jgi:L-amino acid N-acyltransferase YncA
MRSKPGRLHTSVQSKAPSPANGPQIAHKCAIRDATLADTAGIARVAVDTWRTAYRGIVPDAYLDGLKYDERDAGWRRAIQQPDYGTARFLLVASDPARDGEIVGFAGGGKNRGTEAAYDAELCFIYVREARAGCGIGRDLVAALATRLVRAGFRSMIVWVLRDNARSRRFYERLGGAFLDEKEFEIGGARLVQAGYGYRDLPALAKLEATA